MAENKLAIEQVKGYNLSESRSKNSQPTEEKHGPQIKKHVNVNRAPGNRKYIWEPAG